jgi:predicted transcriptional regulator
LYEQGYTKKEIADKLKVSRSNIAKYVRGWSPEREGNEWEQTQRRAWVRLMKNYYPEKLAQFI